MFNLFKRRDAEAMFIASRTLLYTPDICLLEAKLMHRIFIPDETMRGHYNYQMIGEHSAYLCLGYTYDRFECFRRITNQSLIAIPSGDKQTEPYHPRGPARIKGEVHLIETAGLIKLDNHKENGVQFERKRVRILVAAYPQKTASDGNIQLGQEHVFPIEMWMYVAKQDYWEPLIDDGYLFKPVDVFVAKKPKKWLTKYYQFLKDPKGF